MSITDEIVTNLIRGFCVLVKSLSMVDWSVDRSWWSLVIPFGDFQKSNSNQAVQFSTDFRPIKLPQIGNYR